MFLTNSQPYSQVKNKKQSSLIFSLGMGIDYGATPSYTDYLRNELPVSARDSIKTFSTGIEFFGGIAYEFAKNISVKLDYSYFIRSNSYSFIYYVFDYTITSHQPYLMIFYNLKNPKYTFKFGAGGGFHLYKLENNVNTSNTIGYTANGFSFRGEVIFGPKLSKNLETYISGFVFASSTSSLKDSNGSLLKGTSTGKEVNLGGYGVGARLGLSFYLN
ncbi:MAG TPA: hypothetical protein VGK25_10645 [Ignavibacteria bacterium]